ncbi:MAG: gliding motility protein GldL [Muribaculaceae bacterium]|nr:gliding motility protein GldL [Muribaculaceae bacterium]
MGKIKGYRNAVSRFIASDNGQRFFNFAYSIGAAIVIWGALFKILHLPGGNMLLSIGMGTEVLMFVLTAFDRPPRTYNWENVFPALDNPDEEGITGSNFAGGGFAGGSSVSARHQVSESQARKAAGVPDNINLSEEDTRSLSESIAKMAAASDQLARMAELTSATQTYLDQMAGIAQEMTHLRETTNQLNQVSDVLLNSYKAITDNSETISKAASGYADEMQNLSRNIGGLNTIYEIQLKSISSQLDSIDRVNRGIKDIRDMYEKSSVQSARYAEETERMARYMQQLNAVYEKMITAMTINMYNPMMGGGANVGNPSDSSKE